MSYTEVESVGWFTRIKDSIAGVGCGMLLFILAFPLLWWNEGRAVHEAAGIASAKKAVINVQADKVESSNDGKLVHVSGQAATTEKLVDDKTQLTATALRLRRNVSIYQWRENKKSEKRKKVGGGEETVNTYTYEQVWTDKPLNSSSYKEKSGHENIGALPFENATTDSKAATLGAFKLGEAVTRLSNWTPLSIEKDKVKLPDGFKAEPGDLYKGVDPTKPAVGDVKVTFESVQPGEYTIMAAQRGDSFTSYKAASKDFFEVRKGNVSADQICQGLESANNMMTWILRVVGFFMFVIAVSMILKPLSVMADVLPFLGNMVEFGAGLAGIAVAIPCTLITVAIAWIVYRPVIGVALLVVSVGAIYLFYTKVKKPAA